MKLVFFQKRQSYRVAKSIMKEKAVSFYQAFSRLKKQKFLAVCAVYAFCRHVDDLVDQGCDQQNVLDQLTQLETALNHLDHGDGSAGLNYPWWNAFVDTYKKYQMKAEPFLWQIEGQRLDFYFQGIHNLEDLIQYSKLVAGSVGYMMLPILVENKRDKNSEELKNACIQLGIGMQITNILRDIGEDFKERNRVYLPQKLMDHYELTREDLHNFCIDFPQACQNEKFQRFVSLWEVLANQSAEFYSSFTPFLPMFEKSCRIPLLAAASIYHSIEDAVRENGYDCFTKRCYTSKEKRNLILEQIMLERKNDETRG